MFRDSSLAPAEAIRLAALGMLAEMPRGYADLANEIRHFTSRIAGPSLDLMGTSLELLRYEGLVAVGGNEDGGTEPKLSLTPAGNEALLGLLRAALRAPTSDLARLALLLKLRFLHHLPLPEQAEQIGLVITACASERAQLAELHEHNGANAGLFLEWLSQDIARLDAGISWLRARRASRAADAKA
jgi:DNA-binding PadR family transcriptional regulator